MARFPQRLLAASLAAALFVPAAGLAQSGARINVLSGEHAIHNTTERVATEPIVEVVDGSGSPLAGIEVEFRAPTSGPSVTFFGATYSTKVTTGENGRAEAPAMTPNEQLGSFQIEVLAMLEGEAVSTSIPQSNAETSARERVTGKKKLGWRIWAALGAAAATGVIVGVRGSGNDTSTPTTSVGVGGVTVGQPR